MLYHRTIDRILIVAVPVVLFVYASTHPVQRLQPDMPADFVDPAAIRGAKRKAEEYRIAQAYWHCAQAVVQYQYSYGTALPDRPPASFSMYAADVRPEVANASRLRYWNRLRQFWNRPDCWRLSREWNVAWLTNPIGDAYWSIANYLKDLVKITGTL